LKGLVLVFFRRCKILSLTQFSTTLSKESSSRILAALAFKRTQ
jgi:hypothetical protein